MWPLTMYISSGLVAPTFVQYTSSRGPLTACGMSSARTASFGCFCGSLFTPVGARLPLIGMALPRPRPWAACAGAAPRPEAPAAAVGAADPCAGAVLGAGLYSYVRRATAEHP